MYKKLVLTAVLACLPAVAQSPAFTVYASGLNGPRGLRFGTDGNLYVAEAGTGGTNTTGTACQQVPAPFGPYAGGRTGRITKVTSNGTETQIASDFPSTKSGIGDVLGVASVAFLRGQLYALITGGGCSHGNPDVPNGVARVDPATGKWTVIADLGKYIQQNKARYPSTGDFDPDGSFYSMIAVDSSLYIVEANHGQVLQVTPGGGISEVLDVSASEGHIVPTAIEERFGTLYVGNLGTFPIAPESERVLALRPDFGLSSFGLARGFASDNSRYRIVDSEAGFTAVVALGFGPDGLLYALELSTAAGMPSPGTGKVVRLRSSGEVEDVVTGLTVPTGMTFGPDRALYVANIGAGPAGAGQILRFTITPGY